MGVANIDIIFHIIINWESCCPSPNKGLLDNIFKANKYCISVIDTICIIFWKTG